MEKKVFLLDAFALVFRAYYALIRNPRLTSKGKNTNAQFGFTNALVELITKQKPSHMAVCFDTSAPTERHTDFADYKANRQETPEDISAAVPDIKKIIEGFNIPVIGIDGYEADDVIGTLSKLGEKAGYEVYMVTPDKDYGQLVSEKIKIYKPAYQGNDAEILGPAEICAKWNIKDVTQVIDMLGMMGDAVDNIPGIPGVGEKTAAKFLAEYGSLENTLANADKIKGAMGEKVKKGKKMAILSKKLATIITNVPVEFHEEDFRLKEWNKEKLKEVFAELEFRTLGKRLLGEEFSVASSSKGVVEKEMAQGVQTDLFGNIIEPEIKKTEPVLQDTESDGAGLVVDKNINNTPHKYEAVEGDAAIKKLVAELKKHDEICFDTETTGIDANDAELVGLSFSVKPGEAFYVPCPADQIRTKEILAHFDSLFSDKKKIWIGQNTKYDLLMLKWYGVEIKGELFDTMLAHYVIEPDGKRSMDILSEKFLGYEPVHIEELIGKKGKTQGNMRDAAIEKVKEYAGEDADITLQLKNIFVPLLKSKEVEKVFNEVENPLVKVLVDMEYEGIRVDMNFLADYSKELEKDAKKAEESVYQQAGVRFNLASPKQLGEVLFDKLKLDASAKKTKTGQYQTGEDVLLKLAVKGHQIVDDILTFRELTKLKSTYVDALPQMINRKTGRVHTSYGQAVAVTGRLQSNNPNLQNIPVRTERGKEVRKAFIPRDDDHILLSADYSQIELRIVASISGDKNMCKAFKDGTDIHTATAARVYNVSEKEVTKEMRYKAKSVNFGIIYGQGAFGLADNLGISRTEAKEIIDNYKKEFPGIQKYMDDTINFARENGYVETLMGRKRWLRDINSANFTVRGFAERNAINSPIQGTAADMIKLAMQKVHAAMKKEKMQSKMLLQVHDELVFDALKTEVNELKPLILECMQSAMVLPHKVPVTAECGEGKNWLEAH
ncbi:MAG: DNA polymerase I [Chitinophagaceae bacterium]|jgi:DNA polymerase-1|nr:DNA polymerase I [Chitinophagaceae bacterium]MBK8301266.1 DNA polymerase I [Chitinophagaceae bacterium]MBK9658405.1 DNA polymerase I [Chitinophagaceae bacterium]MBK9938480.1 DNA polymerase I [Chitinophagaceae bacterium]MBP6232681.1 DNA polymerase I [Chitinophagaceae bacterium]